MAFFFDGAVIRGDLVLFKSPQHLGFGAGRFAKVDAAGGEPDISHRADGNGGDGLALRGGDVGRGSRGFALRVGGISRRIRRNALRRRGRGQRLIRRYQVHVALVDVSPVFALGMAGIVAGDVIIIGPGIAVAVQDLHQIAGVQLDPRVGAFHLLADAHLIVIDLAVGFSGGGRRQERENGYQQKAK